MHIDLSNNGSFEASMSRKAKNYCGMMMMIVISQQNVPQESFYLYYVSS